MTAFCRLADRPIRLREPVAEPDALIVQDATLLHQVDLFAGLRPDGFVLVNSTRSAQELGIGSVVERLGTDRAAIVAASRIAVEHLGRPLPGAALLGAFAALTGEVSLAGVEAAIAEQFTGAVAEGNAAAARAAYTAAHDGTGARST